MVKTPRVVLLMVPFAGFDRDLLEGISRYTQFHGPWMFYRPNEYPEVPWPASESVGGSLQGQEYLSPGGGDLLPRLRQWGATGVIGRILNAQTARKILACGLPAIGIDFPQAKAARKGALAKISEIRTDSHQAGRLAAEHFLDRGFRHFAFCGFSGRDWSNRREEGFCQRLQEAGYASTVYQSVRPKRLLSWEEEQPRVVAWLKALPRPVGIMACNDDRGRQVLEASLLAGLSVPDDVAVVGADDDHVICNLSNPPLSSVVFNIEQAGYRAAELLDGLMAGRITEPQEIVVDPLRVVARRSTDVIAVEDRHVARSLQFIRDQVRQPIGVVDVVTAAGISRRGLEIRFRRALGHSIRSEIQRVRLAFARQLLAETHLPIQRIAELAGFSSLPYFSNVFHREVGLTLAEYRRRSRSP
jgi:LacI family transcriptional regulator